MAVIDKCIFGAGGWYVVNIHKGFKIILDWYNIIVAMSPIKQSNVSIKWHMRWAFPPSFEIIFEMCILLSYLIFTRFWALFSNFLLFTQISGIDSVPKDFTPERSEPFYRFSQMGKISDYGFCEHTNP